MSDQREKRKVEESEETDLPPCANDANFRLPIPKRRLLVKRVTPGSLIPYKASRGAAGYELACGGTGTLHVINPGTAMSIDIGIQVQVPKGTYGRIAPRSSVNKKMIFVGAGVIDEDYTGNVFVMLCNLSNENFFVKGGDRIAQLILEKIEEDAQLVVTDVLEETERGSGAFGSTGEKHKDWVEQK